MYRRARQRRRISKHGNLHGHDADIARDQRPRTGSHPGRRTTHRPLRPCAAKARAKASTAVNLDVTQAGNFDAPSHAILDAPTDIHPIDDEFQAQRQRIIGT
jgi:hypothetical protein